MKITQRKTENDLQKRYSEKLRIWTITKVKMFERGGKHYIQYYQK